MNNSAAGFCTVCGVQVASFEGLQRCPHCGTQSLPCSFAEQVQVTVNLQELRVLCMWAERWALEREQEGCNPDLVYAIATRLRNQLPTHLQHPLTMADELMKLREAGVQYSTNHPAGGV